MNFITSSWLFQAANVGLLLSYAAFNILWLRICLALASLFFIAWGLTAFEGAIVLDTVIWNSVFAAINLAHAGKILYDRRPIEFEPDDWRADLEAVFAQIFEPVGMSRLQFKTLVQDGGVEFLKLDPGEIYVGRGTPCDRLSIIVVGRLQVISEGGVEGAILGADGIEVIDGVEYAASRAGLEEGNSWSVDVIVPSEAKESVQMICWDRDELESRLAADGPMGARPAFEAAMGRDVVKTFFTASRALTVAALRAPGTAVAEGGEV